MYVTTFYSFKGGVGRTMALVNAAVELANRGRRVLAVDFDLEAPGLDSFHLLRRPKGTKTPGIVDFVHEFLNTAHSPDEAEFRYRVPGVGEEKGGELWIMPSGADRPDYHLRFRDIDWEHLYSRRHGFYLFEDLKAQWEQSFKADWVFLDSRTGHTDTGGICTRQLPDAVVAVFFPNAQNLRGLTRIVRQIRAEAKTPRQKEITLHFLMSNVPDLDDEDEILRKRLRSFRRNLAMGRDEPLVVHHYPSLSLLEQAVFVQERPKSRLATEYRGVVEAIGSANLSDRIGALSLLRSWRRTRWSVVSRRARSAGLDQDLERIEQEHANDPRVLQDLAEVYAGEGRPDEARRLLDSAIDQGSREPEVFLSRGHLRRRSGDTAGATGDAIQALTASSLTMWQVRGALALASAPPDRLLETPALEALSSEARLAIGEWLARNGRDEVRRTGIAVLERTEPAELSEDENRRRRRSLGRLYLRDGRCGDAERLLRPWRNGGFGDAFNYGMARWGMIGAPEPALFRTVVGFGPDAASGAHSSQRMAVSHWAAGDAESACAALDAAAAALVSQRTIRVMSCWRYAEVPKKRFQEDLDEIRALIDGDSSRRPRFMPASATGGAAGDD